MTSYDQKVHWFLFWFCCELELLDQMSKHWLKLISTCHTFSLQRKQASWYKVDIHEAVIVNRAAKLQMQINF